MIDVCWGHRNKPSGRSLPPPDVRAIARRIAALRGYSFAELIGPRRTKKLVHARHEAYWHCRNEAPWASLPMIAEIMNRDHTSVMYGIKRHEERLKNEQISKDRPVGTPVSYLPAEPPGFERDLAEAPGSADEKSHC